MNGVRFVNGVYKPLPLCYHRAMGTNEGRDRRREGMRRKILAAAMRLFVRQGFDNVTLRGVAASIGYSPAAIYRYFAGKREILAALRAEGFSLFVERQKRVLPMADPLERLRAAGADYLHFARTHPEYFHLMFNMELDSRDLTGDWLEKPLESFDILQKMANDCLEAGYFPGHSSEAVVMGLWAAAHGLANLLLSGRVEAMAGDQDVWALLESITSFNLRTRFEGRETAPDAARGSEDPS